MKPWRCHQMETFSALVTFVRGIHQSPVNCLHRGHWQGALMFLWCALEPTVEQTIQMLVIWDVTMLIMTSLSCSKPYSLDVLHYGPYAWVHQTYYVACQDSSTSFLTLFLFNLLQLCIIPPPLSQDIPYNPFKSTTLLKTSTQPLY